MSYEDDGPVCSTFEHCLDFFLADAAGRSKNQVSIGAALGNQDLAKRLHCNMPFIQYKPPFHLKQFSLYHVAAGLPRNMPIKFQYKPLVDVRGAREDGSVQGSQSLTDSHHSKAAASKEDSREDTHHHKKWSSVCILTQSFIRYLQTEVLLL